MAIGWLRVGVGLAKLDNDTSSGLGERGDERVPASVARDSLA